MVEIQDMQQLNEKELMNINGGFSSAGEVFGYYMQKASRILDLSRSGFIEVFQRRTYYY